MFSGIGHLGSQKCKSHYSFLVQLQSRLKIQNKELNYLVFQDGA